MLSIQDNCHLLSKVCNLIRLPNIPFQMKMQEAQGTGLDWLGISVWSSSNPQPSQPLQIYLSCPEMILLQHRADTNVPFKHRATISTANSYSCLSAACSNPDSVAECGLTPFPACFPPLWILQGRSIQQLQQKADRWLWQKSVEVCSQGGESLTSTCWFPERSNFVDRSKHSY